MDEGQICDVIDELWEHYSGEGWFEQLVKTGEAGKYLRERAVQTLQDNPPSVFPYEV